MFKYTNRIIVKVNSSEHIIQVRKEQKHNFVLALDVALIHVFIILEMFLVIRMYRL